MSCPYQNYIIVSSEKDIKKVLLWYRDVVDRMINDLLSILAGRQQIDVPQCIRQAAHASAISVAAQITPAAVLRDDMYIGVGSRQSNQPLCAHL